MHQRPLRLEDYEVSETSGFLPPEPLLSQLPREYGQWEEICRDLPRLIQEENLDAAVASLPCLSTKHLHEKAEWRRAYVLLGFIANAYLWGSEEPKSTLPANISVPFLHVSDHMRMPPIPTYAAENLWNFTMKEPGQSPDDPDNFSVMTSFTGLEDENWFFALPTAIESKGAPLVPLTLDATQAATDGDSQKLRQNLKNIAGHISDLTRLLPRINEKCRPDVFYTKVRPFLAGTASSEVPGGMLYETGDGAGRYQKYKGPTAAQSSLFHFLDIALGIKHRPTGTKASPDVPGNGLEPEDPFLKEMREYMPEPHRRFLESMAQVASIRQYIESNQDDSDLSQAYNNCLTALAAYRSKHIQVVTRYIIVPSRAAARKAALPETEPGTAGRLPADTDGTNASHAVKESVALGTGGTAPVEFLRQVREETRESSI